jgi:Ala-tRNA(Pro) deacylase
MGVPDTITNYLRAHDVSFQLVEHPVTRYSNETAQVAHVPGDRLAKAVVLADDDRYFLAVVPASRRLDTEACGDLAQCRLELADEGDFPMLFRDCRPGAVPPLGEAYGVQTIIDDAIDEASDVYFEAGDHENLVHVTHNAFVELMPNAWHGHISSRA